MQQALPCPPVFRPSARVRWSNCRPLCLPSPGPWLLARRLGEARRPGSGVGVVLDPGPLRSAAFVRASFSARRGVRLGCRICSVRPMRAGFSGDVWCSTRWAVPGRSARCDRSGRAFSEREVFDSVRGNGSLHLRSRSAAFKRASFSEREVFDSAPANGGRSTLGAGSWGRSARRRTGGRSFSEREVFDSCRRTRRFTWWRTFGRSARRRVRQPVGVSGIAARLELPEPDERRHAGVDRFVEQVAPVHAGARAQPRSADAGLRSGVRRRPRASVQRLGGARPQPQRRIRPSRRQPARGRARCGSGSSTSSRPRPRRCRRS